MDATKGKAKAGEVVDAFKKIYQRNHGESLLPKDIRGLERAVMRIIFPEVTEANKPIDYNFLLKLSGSKTSASLLYNAANGITRDTSEPIDHSKRSIPRNRDFLKIHEDSEETASKYKRVGKKGLALVRRYLKEKGFIKEE